LERAARGNWPIQADFAEDAPTDWPAPSAPLSIRHLVNNVDPVSRTFGFYLVLSNQSRSYAKDGQTFLVWRFRPGQRVRLQVPVEEFGRKDGKDGEKVSVLPVRSDVCVWQDAYAFRYSCYLFERCPMRVLYEDR